MDEHENILVHLRPSRRKHSKLSIEDALKDVEAASLALEQSYRLTDTQEKSIQKCFDIVRKETTDFQGVAQREKSNRSFTVYRMLHDIRFLLGVKPFLLCALALTPTRMQTFSKNDAATFPRALQTWWNALTRLHTRLEALAGKYKDTDESIPRHAPDDQPCELLPVIRPAQGI